MISCEDLGKVYAGVERVHGVSFEARPGEVLGMVGPNGAGKSTTLRMILGLTRPSSGRVTIDGRAYRDLPDPLRAVGAALDDAGCELGLSPLRVLRAWARSNRLPTAAVDEVVAVMGLAAVADRPVRQFSLGMRKRVWLALAMLGRPRHLIVDEPLNGLDPPSISWLRDLLRRLAAEGTAVVVASHVLAEQERLCDYVVVLAAGRVVSQGRTTDLIRQYAPVRTRVQVAPGDACSPVRGTAVVAANGPARSRRGTGRCGNRARWAGAAHGACGGGRAAVGVGGACIRSLRAVRCCTGPGGGDAVVGSRDRFRLLQRPAPTSRRRGRPTRLFARPGPGPTGVHGLGANRSGHRRELVDAVGRRRCTSGCRSALLLRRTKQRPQR